jgi:hypothetical protein
MQVQANEAYVEGDFAQAAQLWSRMIQSGHETGDLYYNLGNALYRDERIPEAILAWRRAEGLSPRDGDIAANLARARGLVQDQTEPDSGSGIFFWRSTLSIGEQGWLAAILVGVLGLLGLVSRVRSGSQVGLPAALIAVPAFFLGASTLVSLAAPLGGVILVDEVEVRSAGGQGSGVVLFALHAGAEVVLGDSVGSWQLVELPDGRRGWVPVGSLGVVDATAPIPTGPRHGEGTTGGTG